MKPEPEGLPREPQQPVPLDYCPRPSIHTLMEHVFIDEGLLILGSGTSFHLTACDINICAAVSSKAYTHEEPNKPNAASGRVAFCNLASFHHGQKKLQWG